MRRESAEHIPHDIAAGRGKSSHSPVRCGEKVPLNQN